MPKTKNAFVREKKLVLNGKVFPLGAYEFEKEIGSGANGTVFVAESTLLRRKEAVKLWFPKSGDRRDKVRQGMLEVQKQASELHSQVIKIFHADILDGIFYSTMELFEGPNLRTWCKNADSTLKWTVAYLYLHLMEETSKPNLFHGDPHAGNVLVSNNLRLALCDYGTSYYSNRDASWKRHWRIVDEVMHLLLSHFKTFSIIRRDFPEVVPRNSAEEMVNAYYHVHAALGGEVYKDVDGIDDLTAEQQRILKS